MAMLVYWEWNFMGVRGLKQRLKGASLKQEAFIMPVNYRFMESPIIIDILNLKCFLGGGYRPFYQQKMFKCQ